MSSRSALMQTFDASPRRIFARSRKVEASYAKALRFVAGYVGQVLRMFDPAANDNDGETGFAESSISLIERILRDYSNTIDPWAKSAASRMIAEVDARDKAAWMRTARKMGASLRAEIATAPVGVVVRQRLDDQVKLIKSIPLEAAKRVRELANEGIVQGTRPEVIAQEIMKMAGVTKSRAMLIARTEVSRTATELTRARAEYVGSTAFIWRTSKDERVRESHKRLEGQTFRWDTPPECDPGHFALPGGIFNCRCYPEPVIPTED